MQDESLTISTDSSANIYNLVLSTSFETCPEEITPEVYSNQIV